MGHRLTDSGCAILDRMPDHEKRKLGRPKGSGKGRSRERGKTKAIAFELAPHLVDTLDHAVVAERRTRRAVIELALEMYFAHRGYMEAKEPPGD